MSDGEALLKRILLEPEDDTLRLVYADWLQENGQGERAEFIRAQVLDGTGWLKPRAGQFREWFHFWPRDRIYSGCPGQVGRHDAINFSNEYDTRERGEGWVYMSVRRGFVTELRVSAAEALLRESLVARVFRNHPVRTFRLHSRYPVHLPNGQFVWRGARVTGRAYEVAAVRESADVIPERIVRAIPGELWVEFGDMGEALRVFEHACLAWGRSLAGLPPPEWRGHD